MRYELLWSCLNIHEFKNSLEIKSTCDHSTTKFSNIYLKKSTFQNPVKQEPIFHLESSSVFHVKETVSVLKELLSVHPVFREQLLMATRLSVVGFESFLFFIRIIQLQGS